MQVELDSEMEIDLEDFQPLIEHPQWFNRDAQGLPPNDPPWQLIIHPIARHRAF